MKWLLLAAMLDMQPIYDSQKTCDIAAKRINEVYYQEAAVCIPLPAADLRSNEQEAELDRMFAKFFELVDQIKQIEEQALDTHINR